MQDPLAVAVRFNEKINQADADALAALMTPDHRFIDSAGTKTEGRSTMHEGWAGFFRSWPDYRNEFRQAFVDGNQAIFIGSSHCSDPALEGPAIWRATVKNGCVSEWRVWDDTPANRLDAGLDRAEPLDLPS